MAEREEPGFEESLERLEEIVGLLERGDAPLEEGLGLFEEGVALSRRCHELLAEAEQRIRKLVKDDGGEWSFETVPDEDDG
jgi:exodeoxyribonuclease VII small subunit